MRLFYIYVRVALVLHIATSVKYLRGIFMNSVTLYVHAYILVYMICDYIFIHHCNVFRQRSVLLQMNFISVCFLSHNTLCLFEMRVFVH